MEANNIWFMLHTVYDNLDTYDADVTDIRLFVLRPDNVELMTESLKEYGIALNPKCITDYDPQHMDLAENSFGPRTTRHYRNLGRKDEGDQQWEHHQVSLWEFIEAIEPVNGHRLYKANICIVRYRQLLNPDRKGPIITGQDIFEKYQVDTE